MQMQCARCGDDATFILDCDARPAMHYCADCADEVTNYLIATGSRRALPYPIASVASSAQVQTSPQSPSSPPSARPGEAPTQADPETTTHRKGE